MHSKVLGARSDETFDNLVISERKTAEICQIR